MRVNLLVSLVLLFTVLVLVTHAKKVMITQKLLDSINNNSQIGWKAVERVEQSPFAGWSWEDAREQHLFMYKPEVPVQMFNSLTKNKKTSSSVHIRALGTIQASDLPTNFSSIERWPNCVHPIRNQGSCGSCYSFAASTLLSDRFCIASNGTINTVLSAQDLVSCSSVTLGCNGGLPQLVFRDLKKHGIVPDVCLPYVSGNTGKRGTCPKKVDCFGKQWNIQDIRFKVKDYGHIGEYIQKTEHRAEAIQREIMKNGPVDALFNVFSDFSAYRSGVYHHVSGTYKGLHAVRVIGWGVDTASKLPYWLVANSWGTNWGDKGFFKILRGQDACGFEAMVYAGTPDLASAPHIP